MKTKYTVTAHMEGAVAPINMQVECANFVEASEWAVNFGTMSGFRIVGVKETTERAKASKAEKK